MPLIKLGAATEPLLWGQDDSVKRLCHVLYSASGDVWGAHLINTSSCLHGVDPKTQLADLRSRLHSPRPRPRTPLQGRGSCPALRGADVSCPLLTAVRTPGRRRGVSALRTPSHRVSIADESLNLRTSPAWDCLSDSLSPVSRPHVCASVRLCVCV